MRQNMENILKTDFNNKSENSNIVTFFKESLFNAVEKNDLSKVKENLELFKDKTSAEFLAKHGVTINVANFQGRTPLFYANSAKVAALLIDAGADVNAKDKFKRTPLHLIHDVNAAKQLIAVGANINAKDGNDSTPLHYATCKNNKAMVLMLMDKGADVCAKDNKGQTALDEAISYEHWDIAEAFNAKKLIVAGKKTNKPKLSFRKF